MAKRRKKKKSTDLGPLGTMIDIAGAAALGAYAKHKIKKDYQKGEGPESLAAATMVFGSQAMRRGPAGTLGLGGLLGVNSALKDIERQERNAQARLHIASYEAGTDPYSYKPNDNRYAWRLNCEDGSEYGIYPEDYETRDEYHAAIHREKYGWRAFCEDGSEYGLNPKDYESEDEYAAALEEAKNALEDDQVYEDDEVAEDFEPVFASQEDSPTVPQQPVAAPAISDPYEDDDFHVFIYCKVELSETKENKYYRTEDQTLKKGDIVSVPDPLTGEATTGVIITVERHMRFSVPQPVEETYEILRRAN